MARPLGRPNKFPARYILTAAQSNTRVHPKLWPNLQALAVHYGAEIMVARLRYNHTAAQVGQEKDNRASDTSLWYDKALDAHFVDDRVQICPGLIWAGDMNIIPTATNPLSGLDSFTGEDSCIFPHPQLALKSVATAPGTPPKFNYTTGAVTLTNYIKRKTGLKAEFHHAYAALIVEVDAAGDWFVRQINADSDGVICDLDLMVNDGDVTTGHRIEVFTPGDIHGVKIDPKVLSAVWNKGGLLDRLRPKVQVLHDVLNFGSRSHHNTFFDTVTAHYDRQESVEGELQGTAKILNQMKRPWCKTYIAKANHDEHLEKWVETADFRRDPVNALFFLTAGTALITALKDGNRAFDLVSWALRKSGLDKSFTFLTREQSLKKQGIRYDQHGDLGPNGARGSVANIARTGERATIGHSHSTGITQGCYQVGTFSLLNMGYTRGPSSWSHSCALTYANGKRAIMTLRNGKASA